MQNFCNKFEKNNFFSKMNFAKQKHFCIIKIKKKKIIL